MRTRPASHRTPALEATTHLTLPRHLHRYADEVEQWRREALTARALRATGR